MSNLSKFVLYVFAWSLCSVGKLEAMLTVREVLAGDTTAVDWEELSEHEVEDAKRATLLQSMPSSKIIELMGSLQAAIQYGVGSEKFGSDFASFLSNQGLSEFQIKELLKEASAYYHALRQIYRSALGEQSRQKKRAELESNWWQVAAPLIKLFRNLYQELPAEIQTTLKEQKIAPELVDQYIAERRLSKL